MSVAVLGNAAEIVPELLRRGVRPDAVIDQTSAHDPANGIRRVEKQGSQLQNVVIQTYPNVSQFWTYNPAEYLKQPVYDRTHPACNACGG